MPGLTRKMVSSVREASSGWSLERTLLVGTFIGGVLTSTFGLGVNWARNEMTRAEMKATKEITDAKIAKIEGDYVPR